MFSAELYTWGTMKQQTFAYKRLKQAREDKDMSQEQMILKLYDKGLQLSRQTLFNYESGASDPQVTDLVVLADVLGKPIDYFFD